MPMTVALGIFAVCLGFILLALGRRQLRERAMMRKLSEVRLYYANSKIPAEPLSALSDGIVYHLFLSHAWRNGQDQCRHIKAEFAVSLPGLKCFLDVDDLQAGRGAEDVDKSMVFLCFIADVLSLCLSS